MRSWNRDYPPYKVIGNVYYVGSKDLASYLITTPEGHILINSGFEETGPPDPGRRRVARLQDARHQDPAGQPRPLRPRRRPRADPEADRRKVMSCGRRRVIAPGRQGPVPLRRQPLEALPGRPRPRRRRRGQARRRDPGRPPTPGHTTGCTTWTWRVDDGGKARRRGRHRQPERQPRLSARATTATTRRSPTTSPGRSGPQVARPATSSSAPTAATRWSQAPPPERQRPEPVHRSRRLSQVHRRSRGLIPSPARLGALTRGPALRRRVQGLQPAAADLLRDVGPVSRGPSSESSWSARAAGRAASGGRRARRARPRRRASQRS